LATYNKKNILYAVLMRPVTMDAPTSSEWLFLCLHRFTVQPYEKHRKMCK